MPRPFTLERRIPDPPRQTGCLGRKVMMPDPFFEHPVLNSPYYYPIRHWELDSQGQPTQRIIENRRRAEFITPIPQPRKRKAKS